MVNTVKKDFDIIGMTCSACSNRIEKQLNKLKGVANANVNLVLERATVEFNPDIIGTNDVINKVVDLGYNASLRNDNNDREKLHDKDIKNQQYKFLFALILSLPLLWSMVGHFEFLSFLYLPQFLMNPWVQFALATPVQFIIGKQFYIGAYKALKNKSANMDVLVVLGTSAAYFYSLYQTLIHDSSHMVELYYETSAVLITLIILGKLFEAKAKGRSSSAIKKLLGLQAKTATVIRNNIEVEIPLEGVIEGDIIYIRPGEKVPVDGNIIEGTSSLNEAMITGESLPVDKAIGDFVIGSTINKNGFLKVKATKIGKDSVLSQIVKVVEDAQGSKVPIQRLADQISGIFVPIVIGIAILTFLTWFLWITPGNLAESIEKLIAVLVIACPCALGLATPTSIMVGSGKAAEFGILFKGGEHIEKTRKIDTVVLDKTGTITKGLPMVTDIIIAGEIEEREFLSLVASCESKSEHPLAESIVAWVKRKNIVLRDVEKFEALPGYGIKSTIDNKTIIIGNRRLMEQEGIDITKALLPMDNLEGNGKTAMIVSINGIYHGLVAVADTIKETSKEAIERLKRLNINVIMITGDNLQTAQSIAKQVGIEQVIAGVLPKEKANEIKKLQKNGHKVAMVGDGINDAPALAVADIGMAMGTGTDIAIEVADITLINGDLNSIPDALLLSKQTIKNIKQNLFWALAYNVLGIPIAAMGLLAPWVAGGAMAFSSVSVVLNALRLQKIKLKG